MSKTKAAIVLSFTIAGCHGAEVNDFDPVPDEAPIYLAASRAPDSLEVAGLMTGNFFVLADSGWVTVSVAGDTPAPTWVEDWWHGGRTHHVYYFAAAAEANIIESEPLAQHVIIYDMADPLFGGAYPQSAFLALIEPSEAIPVCTTSTPERPSIRGPLSAGEELAAEIGFTLCGDAQDITGQLRSSSTRGRDERCRYYAFPATGPWADGKVVARQQPDGSYRVVEVVTFRRIPGRPLGLPDVQERTTDEGLRTNLGASAQVKWSQLGLGVWSADEHGVRVGVGAPDGVVKMLSGYLPNDCGELWSEKE